MDKLKQKRSRYILVVIAILLSWLAAAGLFVLPIYSWLLRERAQDHTASHSLTTAAPPPLADLFFPPTWTPTATPTSTPTATTVPTYPPWVTWTPTATFTPRPPTATPHPREKTKKDNIRRYQRLFKQAAQRYDLDWQLLAEQAYFESGLNPYAMGQDLDMGMMQIIPATWHRLAADLNVSDPFDAYSNILVAAAYLDQLRDECAGFGQRDVGCMVLAYNWGINNARRHYAAGGSWHTAPYRQRLYVQGILRGAGYVK